MNESTDPKPTPPPIPTANGGPAPQPARQPNRYEFTPMLGERNLPSVLEALLKHPGRVVWELTNGKGKIGDGSPVAHHGGLARDLWSGRGQPRRGSQLWIAPVKIVGGLTLSLFICLPSLYIFLCLSGANARLRQVAGLAMASACLTALLLISFAPVAWVFSQSTDSIGLMGILHMVFWVVALWFGLGFLARSATISDAAGGSNLNVWMLIYIVVSLQMMTAIRPIIGRADTVLPTTKQFFLAHWVDTLTKETRDK